MRHSPAALRNGFNVALFSLMNSGPRRRDAKLGDDPKLVEFGRRLKEARMARGLTQRDVAKVAGMTRQYVGRVEAGTVNLSHNSMVRFASALGVPVSDLTE